MLYEDYGTTMVRLANGTWREVTVEEGFAQGCPLSPIFAAIVLNHILRNVLEILQSKPVLVQPVMKWVMMVWVDSLF